MSMNGAKRACKSLTKAGNACRTQPLRGEDYCSAHHPEAWRFTEFRAGVPGPGSGRKPNPSVPALLREKAEQNSHQLWQVFADCIQSDDPAIRLKAADTLLSWLYSKPKQQTELTGSDGGPLQIALADLMRQRAELRRAS